MKKVMILAALLAATLLSGTAWAGQIYQVTFDTSGIATSDLVLFLQFNALGSPDAASATVDSFGGAASFTEDLVSSTGATVSGTGWVLDNTTYNELYLNVVNVGPQLSFLVNFSGTALDAPTSADLTLFAADLLNTGRTATMSGFDSPALAVTVGGGTVVRSADFDLGNPLASFNPVPEPGTFAGVALAGLLVMAVRRRMA